MEDAQLPLGSFKGLYNNTVCAGETHSALMLNIFVLGGVVGSQEV